MSTQEKKTRIIRMVNRWNKVRWNHRKALRSFSSGAYFTITPEDVRMWSDNETKPEHIHCYIGVERKKMYLILIDSETDKKPLTRLDNSEFEKVVIREFSNDLDVFTPDFIKDARDGNVTVKEALSRNLRWQLMKSNWINEQIESSRDMQVGIARVFASPFKDLENIVRANPNSDIIAIMGLKTNETFVNSHVPVEQSPYQLDLCFWGVDSNKQSTDQRLLQDENTASGPQGMRGPVGKSAPVEDLTQIGPPYNNRSFSMIN